MFKALTAYTPSNIAVFPSQHDANADPSKPIKLWREVSPVWQPPVFGDTPTFTGTFTYTMLACDANGNPLSTPINSEDFYRSYVDAQVRTYRECADSFPNGVPFMYQVEFSSSDAQAINLEGKPAMPVVDVYGRNVFVKGPPFILGSETLLAKVNGEVMAEQYQAFRDRFNNPASMEETVASIKGILRGGGSAEAIISSIRLLLTNVKGETAHGR